MDRRLYNPVLDDNKLNPRMNLIARILLVAAMVAGVALFIIPRVMGTSAFLHEWIMLIFYALPIVLLLSSLAFKMQGSIKSKWPRRIAVWVTVFIILVIVTVVYSFVVVYGEIALNPVAYYTHTASGHKLVVMKGREPAEDASDSRTFYGVYPTRGRWCYAPLLGYPALLDYQDPIYSSTGVDYVQWSEDGSTADVTIIDDEGNERHILIDYNADEAEILQNLVEEYEAQAEESDAQPESEQNDN